MPDEERALPLVFDLPCVACMYNLRGLMVAGGCPECGRAVRSSDRRCLPAPRVSEQSYRRRMAKLGMLEVDQAKQLKGLRRGDERLKRMQADEMLGQFE